MQKGHPSPLVIGAIALLLVGITSSWAASGQQGPPVTIQGSEIWAGNGAAAKALTTDGKKKRLVVLSPSRDRIAYYEECPAAGKCTGAVKVIDLDGRLLAAMYPSGEDEADSTPCGRVSQLSWAAPEKLVTECEINPSVGQYIEYEIPSGKTIRQLLGYGFIRSPDGKQVAHGGWIPHFSPPFARSSYLQIDGITVFPRADSRNGSNPSSEPPEVVRARGLTYSGIHDFVNGFVWSPDSRQVALIDCMYDWTADDPKAETGKETNRRCSVVVVAPRGITRRFPLTGVSADDLSEVQLSWTGANQLSAETGEGIKTFNIGRGGTKAGAAGTR